MSTAPATAVTATGAPKSRELVLRIVSAAVLIPLLIGLIALGGRAFDVLVAVVAALSVFEVCAMAMRPLPPVAMLAVVSAALLPLCAPFGLHLFTALAVLLLICVFGGLQAGLWGKGDLAAGVARVPWLVFSLAYAALPLALVAQLRGFSGGDWWVVLLLSITWMNDTGAYFAGRAFGRHRLMPRVSPSKTWEGFAGGLLFSLGAAFAVRAIGFPGLTVPDCLFLGVAAGIVGPSGDLAESSLKRSFGVKDSGKVLPGHGGILDRIDALLFTAPLVYFFALATQRGVR